MLIALFGTIELARPTVTAAAEADAIGNVGDNGSGRSESAVQLRFQTSGGDISPWQAP